MKWSIKDPKFEYFKHYDILEEPWQGHTYFAYDLVYNIKPDMIVELGSYRGMSSFSFLSAIEEHKIKANLYTIDSWKGDEHAGYYNSTVFEFFNHVLRSEFNVDNIEIMRMYFDNAIDNFKDKTVDILHIDGLHTYDAVKHDFDTWKDKVREDGVVLFHDILERSKGFGVYKFWEELRSSYPSFEFDSYHGLGVLCISKGNTYNLLNDDWEVIKRYYEALAKELETKIQYISVSKELEKYKELHNNSSKANYYMKRQIKNLNNIIYNN